MKKTIIYFAILIFTLSISSFVYSEVETNYEPIIKHGKYLKYNNKTISIINKYLNTHSFTLYEGSIHFNDIKYKEYCKLGGVSNDLFKIVDYQNINNKIYLKIDGKEISGKKNIITLIPIYYKNEIYLFSEKEYKEQIEKECYLFLYYPQKY